MKKYLFPISILSILISSCSDSPKISIKKCDSRFGLPAESYKFSENEDLYIESSKHLINIRKYSGEKDISIKDNCGYKEAGTVSCYGFMDIDKGIGFKVCVSPKNGDLQSYAFQN